MLNDAAPEGQHGNMGRDAVSSDPVSIASPANDETGEPLLDPSLGEDITALFDDGKAYAEAELAFQKSRAAFAAHEVKSGLGFALVMLAFFHLALMGAVVGLIIALAPLVGAFAAMGIVVGVLLVGTALFAWLAVRRFKKISKAFNKGNSPETGINTGVGSST